MLRVVIPSNQIKLKKQIKALQYQIKQDTNPKDLEIHKTALKQLKAALR